MNPSGEPPVTSTPNADPSLESSTASSSPQMELKAGPMLRYDTVTEDKVWHGFCLIVVEDVQGQDSAPTLTYSSNLKANSTKLYQFKDTDASFTFWRYKLEIPMQEQEIKVDYEVNGVKNSFHVAGKNQTFRWAGHSCNGFSGGTPTEEWNGADPLWNDLMSHHEKIPFHAVVGGGDQIYCDKLTKEKEMQEWVNQSDPKKRMAMPLTDEIETCIERFFFRWYCEWFGSGTFSKCIAQVPMINMLDDHDLIDGFGTYTDPLMKAPVFNQVGVRGYYWYMLFQLFINPDVDGTSTEKGAHPSKSMIMAEKGTYMPWRHQSFLTYLGPKQYMLLVDCRAERKVDQIVTKKSYDIIFKRIREDVPAGVEHLVILLGVPLAYPRMVFLERTLSSSFNPLIMLAKGLSPGFTNNFNGQVELLDDLGDHWCAGPHKHERNQLVEKLQELVLEKRVRISFISGDVHACGVGVFFGYHQHEPAMDPKYMIAVITSAIVNAPPPPPVISMLNKLAAKKHRSLFRIGTKESMVPLFEKDLQGKNQNDKYIMGARNWCAVTYDENTGELEFDIRVEKAKGAGETKSYAVRTPAPKWKIPEEHHHLLHHKDFEKLLAKATGRDHGSVKVKENGSIKNP